jgi:hypothetical protein
MKQWFYMKNDLNHRENVRGIIQRPYGHVSALGGHQSLLGIKCKHA